VILAKTFGRFFTFSGALIFIGLQYPFSLSIRIHVTNAKMNDRKLKEVAPKAPPLSELVHSGASPAESLLGPNLAKTGPS